MLTLKHWKTSACDMRIVTDRLTNQSILFTDLLKYELMMNLPVIILQITQEYTVNVVTAIEKLINIPPSRHSKENDLERLANVAQKVIFKKKNRKQFSLRLKMKEANK